MPQCERERGPTREAREGTKRGHAWGKYRHCAAHMGVDADRVHVGILVGGCDVAAAVVPQKIRYEIFQISVRVTL
jgi:hypothetical protein